MTVDMRDQLRELCAVIEEEQGALSVDDVRDRVRPLPPAAPRQPRPALLRPLLIAGVAAVLILVLVGGIAWLTGTTTGPPADETTTTVPTSTTVPPTTSVPPTTAPATTTTEAPEAAPPPGEGPKLAFVPAALPSDGELEGGIWFRGALYALSTGSPSSDHPELYRTDDGFTWELVPDFPGTSNRRYTELMTDGERLVAVAMPEAGAQCHLATDVIKVSTSTSGVDWASSTIPLPIPTDQPNSAGCFSLMEDWWFDDTFAVGPEGIVVTTGISVEILTDSFAEVLVGDGDGAHPTVLDFDLDRGVMIVALVNDDGEETGEVVEIDLVEAGYSRAIVDFVDAMAADPVWEPLVDSLLSGAAEGLAYETVGFAWFSPDGVTWRRLEVTGLISSADFLATTTGGTSMFHELGGELVDIRGRVQRSGDVASVQTVADPPQQLLADAPRRGLTLHTGGLGLVGTPPHGWEEPNGTELLFSAGGSIWNRWEPQEFVPDEIDVVGVGDDFVVIRHHRTGQLWVGRLL